MGFVGKAGRAPVFAGAVRTAVFSGKAAKNIPAAGRAPQAPWPGGAAGWAVAGWGFVEEGKPGSYFLERK